MKQLIKDRKVLTLGLCLILVCIFTLTVAYAALNAVLTIQGNAEITASTWDIYLDNPRVTGGSATTDVPEIKTKNSVEFSTTLNLPGDFYEFTVDVVNAGSIDAMIENVVKTPELTTDQAKFLKYEITYQNGESITTKQLLAKDTTMPIRVRIEYRKDLSNTDLPTSQLVLDLALTLEYIQSDETGSTVTNNGSWPIASGDINEIGTIVTIGSEQFYTIGTEGDNVKLLSMYNLYVGGDYNSSTREWTEYGSEATGIQDSTMLGYRYPNTIQKGTIPFSSDEQKGNNYSDYNGSIVETHVNNYSKFLENEYGIDIFESRLMSYDELHDKNTFNCVGYDSGNCSSKYSWIYSTSYWSGSNCSSETGIWDVGMGGYFSCTYYYSTMYSGVRPVIVISKDYFN